MLVHLGRGVSVHGDEIILMRDIQRGVSPQVEGLLRGYESRGALRHLGDAPKTLVICRGDKQEVCYLSCVGLRTLCKRVEQMSDWREVQYG